MITQEHISIIIQVSTLIGMVFGVYLYFRRPQEKSETIDAVFEVRMGVFEKMLCNLRDNHLHTLQTKLEDHISNQYKSDIENAKQHEQIITKLDFLIKK